MCSRFLTINERIHKLDVPGVQKRKERKKPTDKNCLVCLYYGVVKVGSQNHGLVQTKFAAGLLEYGYNYSLHHAMAWYNIEAYMCT